MEVDWQKSYQCLGIDFSFSGSQACGGGRVSLILDSHVALRVIAKGRSSAKSLLPLLRKIMSLSLAFGIAVSIHVGHTRLNIADDLTRLVSLHSPILANPACKLLARMDFFALPRFPVAAGPITGYRVFLDFALYILSALPLWTCHFTGLAPSFHPLSFTTTSWILIPRLDFLARDFSGSLHVDLDFCSGSLAFELFFHAMVCTMKMLRGLPGEAVPL